MSSPERRKGSDWERAIVAYLREHGFPFAERAYGAGRPDDVGDIAGLPGWCLEAKAHKSMDLAGWADEAAKEAENARCPWWAVIAKRRNKPVGQAYVVMSLRQFAELLAEDGGALSEMTRRAEHAEKKWHGWHLHTGTFGITCPLCKASDGAA